MAIQREPTASQGGEKRVGHKTGLHKPRHDDHGTHKDPNRAHAQRTYNTTRHTPLRVYGTVKKPDLAHAACTDGASLSLTLTCTYYSAPLSSTMRYI